MDIEGFVRARIDEMDYNDLADILCSVKPWLSFRL